MYHAARIQWVLALLGALSGAVQASGSPDVEPARFSRATGEITVDGRLTERAWSVAQPVTQFFEIYPGSLAEPAVRTEALFLYDDKYVYVGVIAADPDPASIRSGLVRRDNITADQDFVELRLDPLHTRRSALVFRTNPHGVPTDGHYSEDQQLLDFRPDLEFDVQSSRSEEGWQAEFRIPLSTLRYRKGEDQSWTFVIYRNRPRNSSVTISSSPEPRYAACSLCFARELVGISIDEAAPPVYVTPHLTVTRKEDTTDTRAGLDAKWVARPDTVIDLTLAPDFSQVEADDLQLTANAQFTLALKEKRPFFLEGMDLLSTPLNAIYTRSFSDPSAGARVTHRGNDFDYAALVLRDQGGGIILEPGPRTSIAAPQAFRSTAMVGRYRQDFGQVSLGALASTRLNDDDGGRNLLYGVDGTWAPSSTDRFSAQLLTSATTNPDRPDLLPSWDGRELSGTALALSWQHGSDRWYTSLLESNYSSGFRAWNGFVPQVGVETTSASAGLFFYTDGRFLLRWTPSLQYARVREPGGPETSSDLSPTLSLSLPYNTEFSVGWHPNAKDTTFAGERTYSYFSASLMTAPTAWMPGLSLTATFGEGLNFTTGGIADTVSYTASIPLRFNRLELTTSLGYEAQDSAEGPGMRLFTQENAQVHLLWHFSSRLYAEALYQNSRFAAGVFDASSAAERPVTSETFSALLSYQANWQTRYFIGIRRNSFEQGSQLPATRDTAVFAKFAYVLPRWR